MAASLGIHRVEKRPGIPTQDLAHGTLSGRPGQVLLRGYFESGNVAIPRRTPPTLARRWIAGL